MLLCAYRIQNDRRMRGSRGADTHNVDVTPGQEFVIIGESLIDVKFSLQVKRAVKVWISHRHQAHARPCAPISGSVGGRDRAGADNAHP